MSTSTTTTTNAASSADSPSTHIPTSLNTSLSTRSAQSAICPLDTPPPKLTSAEKRTLTDADAQIQKAIKGLTHNGNLIAYYGWRLKKSQRWSEFGCSSESEYIASRDIPESTWRSCTEVGRLLEPLSFEELCAIGYRKGHALTQVNPELWHDYNWMADARHMTSESFRRLVTLRNRTLAGGEQSVAIQRANQRLISRRKLRAIAKEHSLDSPEDALELALTGVGTTASAQLIAAAKHVNKLLTLASKALHGTRSNFEKSKRKQDSDRLIKLAKKRLGDALTIAVESSRQRTEADNDRLHAPGVGSQRILSGTPADGHTSAADAGTKTS